MTLNILMMTAEFICFVYIGLSLNDTLLNHYWNILIALIILLLLLLARSICIGVFAFSYRNNEKVRIRGKEWVFLSFSGLIKGPITYIFANVIVTRSVPCLDVSNKDIYTTV